MGNEKIERGIVDLYLLIVKLEGVLQHSKYPLYFNLR